MLFYHFKTACPNICILVENLMEGSFKAYVVGLSGRNHGGFDPRSAAPAAARTRHHSHKAYKRFPRQLQNAWESNQQNKSPCCWSGRAACCAPAVTPGSHCSEHELFCLLLKSCSDVHITWTPPGDLSGISVLHHPRKPELSSTSSCLLTLFLLEENTILERKNNWYYA